MKQSTNSPTAAGLGRHPLLDRHCEPPPQCIGPQGESDQRAHAMISCARGRADGRKRPTRTYASRSYRVQTSARTSNGDPFRSGAAMSGPTPPEVRGPPGIENPRISAEWTERFCRVIPRPAGPRSHMRAHMPISPLRQQVEQLRPRFHGVDDQLVAAVEDKHHGLEQSSLSVEAEPKLPRRVTPHRGLQPRSAMRPPGLRPSAEIPCLDAAERGRSRGVRGKRLTDQFRPRLVLACSARVQLGEFLGWSAATPLPAMARRHGRVVPALASSRHRCRSQPQLPRPTQRCLPR